MWIVPAKVAGTWRIETAGGKAQALEATLTQQYQNVSGSVKTGAKQGQVSNGKLRGETFTFSVADDTSAKRDFTGQVNGNRIEGTVKDGEGGGDTKFVATRVGDAK
jgi:hypothetical protein